MSNKMSKTKQMALYAVMALTTLAFAGAGVMKLMGTPELHASFTAMKLPVWFGYFIGAAELAGAIAIWFKRTAIYAAIGLAIIMLGAVYFHLVYTPVVAAIPALVLLVFAAVIALSKRSQAQLSQIV
ncbi:DoxX family protein [Motilimonas eburnea]|uniref:DoxX family protein n=1 Tax=Motilimonas eburnea TaxID=1737488 RepID=UPI001E423258|nr:DoxX family protein [Motilimonas eburnea]